MPNLNFWQKYRMTRQTIEIEKKISDFNFPRHSLVCLNILKISLLLRLSITYIYIYRKHNYFLMF